MKINLRLTSKLALTLTFWVLINYSGWSQIMAMAQTDHQNERINPREYSVKDVLDDLKDKYQVDFMYERKVLEGLTVSPNTLINAQKLEKNLERLLNPFGLKYKKVNRSSYLIVAEKRAKKIGKIDQIEAAPEVVRQPTEYFVSNVTQLSNQLREVKQIDHVISGTVIDDETGEGLPGATILLKGTGQGTTTDINGAFSLTVPDENSVLEISYIGYLNIELAVGNQSQLTILLKSDAQALSEVVVIGYGEQRKSDLTGAVASIQTKDITRSNPVMAARAIQGQVAGATVTKKDNRPGAGYNITIRGENTINNSTQPLVVIDGTMGGDLNNLNPNDIQTMDILKDASSTAIYGSRGANGVIIVTTKKGASGKPRISYDSYIASKRPAHVPRLQNAQEFYKSVYTDRVLEGATPATFTAGELAVVQSGESTDWVDLITKPGLQTSQNLSLSGGNDRTTYRFAGGFLNEDGNVKYTGYKRYNLNAGLDSRISDMFRVGFTSYLTYGDLNVGSQESLRGAFRARPTGVALYDDLLNPTENKDINVNGIAVWMGINDKQVPNPLLDIDPAISKLQTTSLVGTANAYLEFTPVKGLSLRSSISASYLSDRMGDFRGQWSKAQVGKLPRSQYDSRLQGNYTIDNILNYNVTVNKHKINFTGLQSAFYQRNEGYSIFVTDLPYASDWYALNTAGTINNLSSSLVERSLLSFMGRVNYSFNDKYLLTLTGRSDGASQLAEGNKWAFFPSLAVAWRASEEDFIRNLNIFSNLKARVSYGEVGNSTINPYSTQAGLLNTGYDFGGNAAYGFAPSNLGNKDLRWERSKELNLGLDFGFFKNRIAASLEVYDRKTEDLILNQKIPTVTGFADVIANVGRIQNKGVELTLSTVNVVKSGFTWSSNFTFTKNNNKLLELYGDGQTIDKGNKLFVGYPIRSNFDFEFAGIWQTADKELAAKYKQVPGSVKVVDQNNDGVISSTDAIDDRAILGTELPNFLMGMTNKFNYKNLDLSFFMYYRNGSEYFNNTLRGTMGEVSGTRYNRLASLDYWRSDNPSNTYFGVAAANPYRNSINYQDASFLRVSDITLGYTLPIHIMSKWKLSSARVYTQVTNPFIFTKYDGFDPEFNSAVYQDDLPYMTYTLGVNLSF